MEFHAEQNLTSDEHDILQEIMNIAFGRASADLAEVIDIYVELNVPYVQTLDVRELPSYLATELAGHESVSIVEQGYLGKFRGLALLVFPVGAGRELFSLLNGGDQGGAESTNMALMERETLMELGNILIGACVGKIAELLDDVVTYAPPRVNVEERPENAIVADLFEQNTLATVMRTVFHFKDRDIDGHFFLINSSDSFGWLKKALYTFMERYA